MFPDVQRDERRLAVEHRVVCVAGGDDFDSAALSYEPGPAAAELAGRGGRKRAAELIEAAECRIDGRAEITVGCAAAVW